MKKTYHLCLSSKDEVMFRCKEDFIRGINCMCIAAYETDASLLAYTFMTNHVHIGIRTDEPKRFIRKFRYPYNRYFNAKYHRHGVLGENKYFQLEINGIHHLITAIAYILRNPLHHGVAATPFGYEYSSIKALFRKEIGWQDNNTFLSRKSEYRYLPNHRTLPKGFKISLNGMILPETVIDTTDVEHLFVTARSFLYYMNRLSGEDWEKDQENDHSGKPPITLELIENGVVYQDVGSMLRNEHGRSNYNAVTDLMLCNEIDCNLTKMSAKKSVYELNKSERENIARDLVKKYHIPYGQAIRCLAFGKLQNI